MKKQTTIVDSILDFKNRPEKNIAIQFKKKSEWVKLNWSQYYQFIERLALALQEELSSSSQQKPHIAVWSHTRFEWSLIDCASLASGWALVPIYQNSTPEEVAHIVNHSDATVLFIENQSQLKAYEKIKSQLPKIEKVYFIEKTSGFLSVEELLQTGEKLQKQKPEDFRKKASQVQLLDTATIIYTSGTTGLPKGVELTHQQIMSEVGEAFPLCGVSPEDVSLSFLPYAHILGRVEHWGSLISGYTLSFAENIESLRKNLKEIRPTIMVAVPRIFEKIYASLISQMENQPLKAKLFNWALQAGNKISDSRLTRSPVSWMDLGRFLFADTLVLKKVKEAFGGRLRFCISGGAPIQADISQFFHSCGVLILEGYGLTETTAAICVNTPFQYRFGSVGKPIGDTQIKIAADGEILVKSHKVMKCYYKNPEATAEVMEDGWFKTGDIGEILTSGDLRITDRKKDLIKTAGGKYVAPQKLEGLLKMNNLISQVLIHGDQKKYIVALVTLEKPFVEKIFEGTPEAATNWSDMIKKHEVESRVRRIIAETNAQLSSFETIKKFKILSDEFTIENGALTPSLKVKRKFLDKKFKTEIDSLYSEH